MKNTVSTSRIQFLDGLRGVAILLVILFHAFTRWAPVMPYGSRFADFPLAKFGHLGVQLFFLISGFVIFMTLGKATSLRQFAVNRWLRLFPAMLLCSLVILATAPFLPDRPGGVPALRDFIPGVLFLHPDYLTAILGVPFDSLDGSFWSLYVEVQFYVVAGVAYFWGGRRVALAATACVFFAWLVVRVLVRLAVPGTDLAMRALDHLGAQHFGWFLTGAVLFLHSKTGRLAYLAAALGAVSLAIVDVGGTRPALLAAAALTAAVFVIPVVTGWGRAVLSSRLILLIGAVSYPLYLLHQNITVGAVRLMGRAAPQLPAVLLPVAPTLMLIAVAWLVSTHAEPQIKRGCAASLRAHHPVGSKWSLRLVTASHATSRPASNISPMAAATRAGGDRRGVFTAARRRRVLLACRARTRRR